MTARLALLRRAALAAFAAGLLALPALAEEKAALAEPLICGAAAIYTAPSKDPELTIHSSAFDAVWIEALFAAGCVKTQAGCNTCVQTESGKTICGAADCAMTTPAQTTASCDWPIADFKCREWRDDSRVHEGGWAADSSRRPPTVVQAD